MMSTNSAASTVIAILTCDRSKGFYLPQTAKQIDAQGGRQLTRRVYVDGEQDEARRISRRLRQSGVPSAWDVIPLGPRAGSTEAMRRLLVHASETSADLLFFEDDLAFCRNAVTHMVQQKIPPSVGILSFFDMKEVNKGAAPGLYRRPPTGGDGMGLWGAQALKFPAEVVAWLATEDWYQLRFGTTRMASDQYMGALVARHEKRNRMAVHIPNLVQHIGHSSACFPGLGLKTWRRATNFAGREFDALALPEMG